ncbi:MAG: hypothetical protein Q4B85_06045 [Lachnospiraceae bacterium]|nr:hypothetical protein [Lachnospiraceae bacterium]
MKTNTDWKKLAGPLICLYVFGMAFLIMMQSNMNPVHTMLPNVDSGVFHYVASVMKDGGLMYRDTFDHKGPLLYAINYAGMLLHYYSGAWFLEFLCILAWAGCTYRTARLFCGRVGSCFTVFLSTTAVLSCFLGGGYPESYSLCCISGALYIFSDYYLNQKISRLRLVVCGGLMGCVLMLKPNLISVWLVFCISSIILKLMNREVKELLSLMGFFILGLCGVLLPFLLYLVSKGILGDFINTYILFNLTYSGDAAAGSGVVVMARDFTRELLTPTLILLLLALRTKMNRPYWWTCLAYTVLTLVLCCMSGSDYVYYRLVLVPCFAAPMAAFLGGFDREKRLVQVLLVLGITVFAQSWVPYVRQCLYHFKHMSTEVDLGDEEHRELFRLIEEKLDEDEPFIVYGNEDAFYYYSHRMAASRYSFQYPVILMDEEIREEFFQEVEENQPKLILVQSQWCEDQFITEFLETHPYECITDLENYALYQREGTTASRYR